MKASPIQQSFNAGEFSPLLFARTDFNKYRNALALVENWIPFVQGGMTRRSGTYFVASAKQSDETCALVPFEFSVTQAYLLEFSNQAIRFFKDRGQIVDGASVYEISSPYVTAYLNELAYAQSADVLYIVHEKYQPRKLTRTGHTAWTIEAIEFKDGPYLPINTTSTQMVASSGTGLVTVTASSKTGINGGSGFLDTDVGRVLRVKNGTTWAWGRITARADKRHVTVQVKANSFPTANTKKWRLGVWSDTTGWPTAVTFYQDRLWFAGGVEYPQRVDGSVTGDYENFQPNNRNDETVADDDACSYTIGANDVNAIRWLLDDEKGLAVGTVGGEWLLRANTYGDAITPTNVKADRPTANGSARIKPVRAGKTILYVQRAKRKVREFAYTVEVDGFRSPDMTVLAEHITRGGLTTMAYQQEPQSLVWAVRNDGALLGLSYEREQDVVGWHRHWIGGVSDAAGSPAKVESVAVIPSPDGTSDELWMVVQRYINGATVRHIEYMAPLWENGNAQADAFFVDSGLTYSGAPVTNLSGLDHLEGEVVSILADGQVRLKCRVTNGAITLGDGAASKIHVGYGYRSRAKTLYIEAGATDGTAQGKKKRIHRLIVRLLDTMGLKLGPAIESAKPLSFDDSLFTGDKSIEWPPGYDTQAQAYLEIEDPVPATILALMPWLRTYE